MPRRQRRYTYLDPYLGGATAVAEACRNIAAVGATPVGATNCLNFGNPEKPEIMWQFARAVDGIRDACERFDVPITGGNVSFYNETEGEGIYPTPVVGVVGLLDDATKRVTHHFKPVKAVKAGGDIIYLMGNTDEELGASEYLKLVHGRNDGSPPRLDLDTEAALQKFTREAASRGLMHSAHDLSDGGLGVAIAESLFGPLGETMGASSHSRPRGARAACCFRRRKAGYSRVSPPPRRKRSSPSPRSTGYPCSASA